MAGRRIGVWGGSFDPVHIGHLILAQEAVAACTLDRMIWMPSGSPPHKQGPVASAEDRLKMVSAAISGHPVFEVSPLEIERSGKSYTLQTLRDLREQVAPDDRLCLLIGADNAVDFPNWYQPEAVLELAEVVVFRRPGFGDDAVDAGLSGRMQFLDSPLIEVSSTEIRARVQAGKPVRYWVPDAVQEYIEVNGLYR